jgi:hypothetical protein
VPHSVSSPPLLLALLPVVDVTMPLVCLVAATTVQPIPAGGNGWTWQGHTGDILRTPPMSVYHHDPHSTSLLLLKSTRHRRCAPRARIVAAVPSICAPSPSELCPTKLTIANTVAEPSPSVNMMSEEEERVEPYHTTVREDGTGVSICVPRMFKSHV